MHWRFLCVCVRDVVVVDVKTPVIMRVSRLNGLRCQTGDTKTQRVAQIYESWGFLNV